VTIYNDPSVGMTLLHKNAFGISIRSCVTRQQWCLFLSKEGRKEGRNERY